MDGFEDMLNSILSSPEEMEKIMGIAQKFTGGQSSEKPSEPSPAPQAGPELDPALLTRLMGLLGKLNSGASDKAALIASMKPYVRAERREALDKALRVVNIARVAREALSEFGGDLNFGL